MTKDNILKILYERKGEKISGQDIADRLSLTRAAVWKAINALKDEGYIIHSTQSGGYLLDSGCDVLTEFTLEEELAKLRSDVKIEVFAELESTNTYLKKCVGEGMRGKTAVLARRQVSGKGRRGRAFLSGEGGVYLSFLLEPELGAKDAHYITLVAAVAAKHALEKTGIKPRIKWPNDILVSSKKICGILTEASFEGETGAIAHAVLGMGFNLLTTEEELGKELSPIATSVFIEGGKTTSRAQFAAWVINEVYELMDMLEKGRIKEILDEYRLALAGISETVSIIGTNEAYEAVIKGLSDEGHLIVEPKGGKETVLSYGEISIKGLYGTVNS